MDYYRRQTAPETEYHDTKLCSIDKYSMSLLDNGVMAGMKHFGVRDAPVFA